MSKPKNREYQVQARIALLVSVSVSADSLEEATQKARGMDSTAFVDVLGECIDVETRITGIYDSDTDLE